MQLNHTHSANIFLEGMKILSRIERLPPMTNEEEMNEMLEELRVEDALDSAAAIFGGTLLSIMSDGETLVIEYQDHTYLVSRMLDDESPLMDIQEDTQFIRENDFSQGDIIFLNPHNSRELVTQNA
jgi:hypothetical protein